MFLLHDPLFFSPCHAYSLSGSSSRSHQNSIDWTLSSSDVIAPSPWTIFGCQNGKILFHCLLFAVWVVAFFRCWKFQDIAEADAFMGVMQVYDCSRKQKTGIIVGRLTKFLFDDYRFILIVETLILEYGLISRNGMITLQ